MHDRMNSSEFICRTPYAPIMLKVMKNQGLGISMTK